MKTFLKIAVVFVLLLGIALYAASRKLERIIERAVAKETGLRVSLENVTVSTWSFQPTIRIKNLGLWNPPHFPDEPFLTFPEILVQVYPKTAFEPTVRFREVRVDLSDASLVKNKEGKINAVVLAQSFQEDAAPEANTPAPSPSSAPEKKHIHIERLLLSIGTIRYRDAASTREGLAVDAGIKDKEFQNVTDLKTVARAVTREILQSAMRAAAMNALLAGSFPPALLLKTDAGQNAIDRAKTAIQKVGSGIKKLLGRP